MGFINPPTPDITCTVNGQSGVPCWCGAGYTFVPVGGDTTNIGCPDDPSPYCQTAPGGKATIPECLDIENPTWQGVDINSAVIAQYDPVASPDCQEYCAVGQKGPAQGQMPGESQPTPPSTPIASPVSGGSGIISPPSVTPPIIATPVTGPPSAPSGWPVVSPMISTASAVGSRPMVTTPARRAVPSRFASRFNRGRGLRGMGDCGLGQILASAVASDAQAAAAGFPAAGKLSSTEDLQVVVNSGGAYVYQDEGQIAQNILTSLGIPLSDAQNLTSAQTQAILNAVAAATSTAAATGAACAVGLFGETSCFNFGSVTVGTTTVYVVAAALALLFLFGGKR